MSVAGRFFVTPHAVERFRERIDPRLDYDAALAAVIYGLEWDAMPPKRLHHDLGVMIRTRGRRHGRYDFRAVVVPGEGALPAVSTILWSGKGR